MTISASRNHRTRTSRAVLATTLASGALVVALSGCAPIDTTKAYAPSDGIRATVGQVAVANLLVIATEDGSKGRVLGAMTNDGNNPVTFTVTIPDDSTQSRQYVIDPGTTYNLNDDDNKTVVKNLDVDPGAVVETTLTSGSQEVSVAVPVLDGTLPAYTDYVPQD